ncbi:MAG TPA: hypothetical protein ENI20_07625 [Bacteroides sp.]|nr:hypothetical protein [Bacteroides sp.]
MDRLFEIGELGVVPDIPAELTNLESVCKSLRSELQKYKNLAGFLGLCLAGVGIYLLLKDQPDTSNEEA